MKPFFKIFPLFFIAVFMGILFPNFSLAALENFTTYTESDQYNVLNIAANAITVTGLQRQSNAMVSKSFSAGYFGSSFEHLVSFQVNSMTGAYDAQFYPWAVANTSSANFDSDPIIGIYVQSNASSPAGSMYIFLFSDDGAVDTSDYYNAGPNGWGTRYYLTIARNGATVTAKIYNDADRTNLLDTLSVTTGNSAYEYVYGTMSRGGGTSLNTTSGFIYDLNLQAAADTTAPFLSNGAPSGALPSGATQTNISLVTDKSATCRYSTVAGTAYGSMTNTFTTTGSASHSTQVTGLANGNTYNYYVRCQDATGNPNTTDYTISFSVASATPGDGTLAGILQLAATYESISVYANFSGDNNSNNSASFIWRQAGGAWKQGMAMTVDRRATVTGGSFTYANPYQNQWRASIIGVQPNTSYDVEVTFIDSGGVSGTNPISQTITTRNDIIPLGSGNTYYVSPTGTGTLCTSGATFATIQQAANCVGAGDTVYIRTGTYPELVSLNRSGNDINWITFMNYGTEVATIDGGSTRARNISITAAQYIRIKGLRFINAYGENNGGAINIDLNSSNIVIEDSYFSGFMGSAIFVGGSLNNPAISQNIVIQRNQILRTAPKGSGYEGHMISFWRTQGGHIIRNNTITDTSNTPRSAGYWDCIGGGSNFTIDGSFYRDSDIYNNYIEGCNDDLIESEGGDMNVRIWGNTLKIGSNGTIGLAEAPIILGPYYAFRNVVSAVSGTGEGMLKLGQQTTGRGYFYHNVFYAPGGYTLPDGFKQTDPGLWNLKLRNNIVRVNRNITELTTVGATPTHDLNYDALYTSSFDGQNRFLQIGGTRYSSLLNLQSSTGQELNGLQLDAADEFIDPANGNFNLISASQLVDRGETIVGFNDQNSPWPYQGAAPDIGAFEYDPGAPSDTTPPVRSSGSPTGTLTAGTTQTNLSLNTNESATCRYSATAGTAYSSMANTFTTTGGTSHSTQVTGLTNGNTYNYYVRCQDTAGNADTSDLTIAFSIAAGDTTPLDATLPTITITGPTALPAYSTAISPISLSGTASDNISLSRITWSNNRGGSGIATGLSNWSIALVNLLSGVNVITVTAYDSSNNISTDTLTVSYSPLTSVLSVLLTVDKTFGQAPLNGVDLTAVVSGTAAGTINYIFYCNRSDPGINVIAGFDIRYNFITGTSKTADNLCNYSSVGTYYAKVVVERGDVAAESKVEITVTANPTPPPLGTTPPSKVTNIKLAAADQQIIISWENPKEPDFIRVVIIRKEGSVPVSRTDGVVVYEGDKEELTDINLDNDKTYYYAIYTYDRALNYSEEVLIKAQPEAGQESAVEKPYVPINGSAVVAEIPAGYKFANNLFLGQRSVDVRYLQILLKAQGTEIYPDALVTGYFGLKTKEAVAKFQEKYQKEILSPLGFIRGTGYAGSSTIAKLNGLLKVSNVPAEVISEKPSDKMAIEEIKAKIAEILKLIAQLRQQLAELSAEEIIGIPSDYKFSVGLDYGQKAVDVSYLQIFLRDQGPEIYPDDLVTGYFDLKTKEAVARFQIKYKIISSESEPGAGYVGFKTRIKINEILGW